MNASRQATHMGAIDMPERPVKAANIPARSVGDVVCLFVYIKPMSGTCRRAHGEATACVSVSPRPLGLGFMAAATGRLGVGTRARSSRLRRGPSSCRKI